MAKTRREFLAETAVGLAAAAASAAGVAPAEAQDPGQQQPAGAPPAFGTGPGVGPQVSVNTFTEAEKLVQVELTKPQLEMAASSWRGNLASVYERRTGPHKVELPSSVAPYSSWNPVLPGRKAGPDRNQFVRSKTDPGPLPKNEDEIAFAPVTRLSRWIETRQITSERLTQIYLKRIEQFNPKLRCIITLTKDFALAQAKQADAEIAAGKYRGPLHGIPWGGKDLLDTAGIPTTYGAEPFRNRIPRDDAAVVKSRFRDSRSVHIACAVRNLRSSSTQVARAAIGAKTDLRAGAKYDSWTFNVFVNNVADKRGVLDGGLDLIAPTNAFFYIQPRTVGLSATKIF